MNVSPLKFTDFVRDMASSLVASAGRTLDLSAGSILRALIESNAAVALWLQWSILRVQQTTRAATSSGADLDSWMADFQLYRLPALPASGQVRFSRLSANGAATIPPGIVVKTNNGQLTFTVTQDTTLSSWQSDLNGYRLPSGVFSIDLPVIANAAGTIGNVQPDTITVISGSLPGIDAVSNPLGTGGGTAAETDDSFRSRFRAYFSARSRATIDAIGYAVISTVPNIKYRIFENQTPDGTHQPGCIVIVLGDAYGSVTDDQVTRVFSAVDLARPVGTTIWVQKVALISVRIGMRLTSLSNSPTDAQHLMSDSIQYYVQNAEIGGLLSITRISEAAYNAVSGDYNISFVTLNGEQSDMTAPPGSMFAFNGVDFV